MTLPPPGRFSNTIGWPTRAESWSATRRPMTSVPLPAACELMNLIGRSASSGPGPGLLVAASISAGSRQPSNEPQSYYSSHRPCGSIRRPLSSSEFMGARAETDSQRPRAAWPPRLLWEAPNSPGTVTAMNPLNLPRPAWMTEELVLLEDQADRFLETEFMPHIESGTRTRSFRARSGPRPGRRACSAP